MTAPAGPTSWQPGLTVTVYTGTYGYVGEIGAYTSAEVEHARLAVGPGTLVLEEDAEGGDGLALAALQSCKTVVVPVTVDDGVKRWSGRASHVETEGAPGRGTVTVTLVDDFAWAPHVLAWPDPTAPLTSPATVPYANPVLPINADPDGRYVRTGRLVTVFKDCIRANLSRLSLLTAPVPHVVLPTASPDTSPSVELRTETRMPTLEQALVPQCREHGYNLTVTLWLPTDLQPPALAATGQFLPGPALLWDVTAATSPAYVEWTDAVGIAARQLAVTHPTAVRATLLGPTYQVQPDAPWQSAEDDPPTLPTAQLVGQVINAGLAASLGPLAFPEAALDTDGGDAADLTDATTAANAAGPGSPESRTAWAAAVTAALAALPVTGRPQLAELAGTAGLSMTVQDEPFLLIRDYDIGSRVVGITAGNVITEYVEKVVVSDTRADGLTTTPQIGDGSLTESTDVVLVHDMARLRAELAKTANRKR